jgi:hypothetical protein
LPSSIDNADSRIASDPEQMFREFFNVVAVLITQVTILIAIGVQILPKSAFARIGVLAQICFAVLFLPMIKRFVGSVSATVSILKASDGSFNFQVFHVKAARQTQCAPFLLPSRKHLTASPALSGQEVLRKHRILRWPSP